MKYLWVVFCACALLVGCGSTVPLSDVPVTDAKPVSASGAGAEGDGAGIKGRAVAPVDLSNSTSQAFVPSEPKLIYFDYDSFVIKPEYQSVIAAHSRFLKNQSSRKVAIEGHTDETGGREYNLALGQKRADAVRDALAILGVSQGQMEAVSFGKEKPAVNGADEGAYSKNRRAEIRYQ
jgi:peptidoglycan-associated lipoprotein